MVKGNKLYQAAGNKNPTVFQKIAKEEKKKGESMQRVVRMIGCGACLCADFLYMGREEKREIAKAHMKVGFLYIFAS